jgi:two-component system, cell cycle sensor histidine kinase and response regulator CckA
VQHTATLVTSVTLALLAALSALFSLVSDDGGWWASSLAAVVSLGALVLALGTRRTQLRQHAESAFRLRDALAARELLQLVAGGPPLSACLERITLVQEQLFAGSLCAVLRLSSDGQQLSFAAGQRMPEAMQRALNGLALETDLTPCCVAAREARPVIARDLMRDEHWQVCRDMARAFHVSACWSLPIVSSQGKVLGTFEAYHRFARAPSEEELSSLQRTASLASLAIERSQAQIAMQDSEARLRKVFEHTPIGIYMRDGMGRLIYENPALERLFHPYNTQVKEAWQSFVHPDDRAETAAVIESLVAGRADDAEQTVRMVFGPNDTRIMHVLSSAIRRDGKLEGIVGAIDEVTEKKRLEEQLAQAQKMEVVGQLAGGIAHDFNNLLTIILNALELVEHGAAPAQRVLVRHALHASERAAELTMQLLTFSRKQPLLLRPANMCELVTTQCAMLSRLLGEAVRIETHTDGSEGMVEADANLFGQLLMNLVVNARDAMPQGGTIAIRVETVIASVPAGKGDGSKTFVRVSVGDTGTGIAPDNLPHIFEPFFTTKDPGKGTGLGLAMVYSIAEQHNGFVEVDTELGRGTVFHVYLPRTTGSVTTSLLSHATKPVRGSEGILLVEDDPAVREMVGAALSHCGYRVFTADHGDGALAVWSARQAEIALLVTDIVMPGGMSGPALARRLRQGRQDLKVVFMSGYGAHEEENEPLSALVKKPLQLLTLASVVRALLDEPEPKDDTRSAGSDQTA